MNETMDQEIVKQIVAKLEYQYPNLVGQIEVHSYREKTWVNEFIGRQQDGYVVNGVTRGTIPFTNIFVGLSEWYPIPKQKKEPDLLAEAFKGRELWRKIR